MNIGIVGTFDVRNYGDLLFPLIAELELRERLGDVTMHRFSYHRRTPPEWPYAVTSITDLPDIIGRLDALLIGGGFVIRFDKDVAPGYAPPAHIHHPTGYWLTPALIAHQYGVPVIWNAPGMHLNEIPAWAEPLLKLTLGLTPYISVRDEPSRAALARFVEGDRVEVVPDTAFGISRLLGSPEDRARPYIVVQPARWMAEFPGFVKTHASRLAAYQLLALPIGPALGDDPDHLGDLPGIVRLQEWPHPLPLAEIIRNASAVVGHSYHLAITALTAGVPVFTSVDLDCGKFTALRDLQVVHRLTDLREADPDWFFSRLGKSPPAASVRAALPALARHWDRVAAIIEAGRLPTGAALSRFLQSLPTLLENGASRD